MMFILNKFSSLEQYNFQVTESTTLMTFVESFVESHLLSFFKIISNFQANCSELLGRHTDCDVISRFKRQKMCNSKRLIPQHE